MFTDFCGSGIWRGSNKDRLSLLHNVWALRGKGSKLGLSQGLGAGTIWKLLHTHVWELMPAVGWYLTQQGLWSGTRTRGPAHGSLACSQCDSWILRVRVPRKNLEETRWPLQTKPQKSDHVTSSCQRSSDSRGCGHGPHSALQKGVWGE